MQTIIKQKVTVAIGMILTISSCISSTNSNLRNRNRGVALERDSVIYSRYRTVLEQLYVEDLQDRKAIFGVFRQHGFHSLAADTSNRWLSRRDSVRLQAFTSLEKLYGWPRARTTGKDAVQEAFLLIQHAPDRIQAEYRKKIRGAYTRGELSSPNYATYMDRFWVNRGRPQLYGTQRGIRVLADGTEAEYLLPVKNLTQLDDRRKKMHLEPLLSRLQSGSMIISAEKSK